MHSSTAARMLRRTSHRLRSYHPAFRIPPSVARYSQASQTPPPSLRIPHTPSPILASLRQQRRFNSSEPSHSRPLTDAKDSSADTVSENAEEIAARKAQEQAYEMTFTCRKCMHRSSHRITKQAYHFGTTLITCPGCKNRHLISDHLKIFSDKSITIEDMLREKGQFIKKGVLGDDGDVEFVDDSRLPKELKEK